MIKFNDQQSSYYTWLYILLFDTDYQATIMTHSNVLQHRGGLDFNALARGGEKSYSTSYLINLDPDLLTLIG